MIKSFGCTEKFCTVYAYTYCVIIMVTTARHIFINIFGTEHFSALKFAVGFEKNTSFLGIPKSPKVGKRIAKIGLGSCKTEIIFNIQYENLFILTLYVLLFFPFISICFG